MRLLRSTLLALALGPAAFLGSAPALRAATVTLESATIADLQAAIAAGALSSEKLVQLSLARIAAYDSAGPKLKSIILVNPNALAEARAADTERAAGRFRGPLHGMPVILKDNHDTFDLPTTGGSVFLEGSVAPDDAFIVKKLREAGAVILAKANLSEFASSAQTNGFSSLGGQTLNPHDLTRGPAGSSGGSGAAVAAWFAPVALGTDTGGSIRNPAFANGVAAIKPTRGLISRDGIIPLGLSFDTSGPMARSVYDVAVSLGAMTGIDPADPATATSLGKFHSDYTVFLDKAALRGARLGFLTDYPGAQPGVQKIMADSLARLRAAGAEIVEVALPKYILDRQPLHEFMRPGEFKAQVADYLATLQPGYPRTLAEIIALTETFTPKPGQFANPSRWASMKREEAGLALDDPEYLAVATHAPALIAAHLDALLIKHRLDAFIYPTNQDVAQRIDRDYSIPRPPTATSIANITGFPDVIVPAGLTEEEKLPVTLSFMGTSYSEPRLLALAYAFEQTAPARFAPPTTPALPGETFTY